MKITWRGLLLACGGAPLLAQGQQHIDADRASPPTTRAGTAASKHDHDLAHSRWYDPF